jgi:hypothetical protein
MACQKLIGDKGVRTLAECTKLAGEAVLACETVGLGPEDPLADLCAAALGAGFEVGCTAAVEAGRTVTINTCMGFAGCNSENNMDLFLPDLEDEVAAGSEMFASTLEHEVIAHDEKLEVSVERTCDCDRDDIAYGCRTELRDAGCGDYGFGFGFCFTCQDCVPSDGSWCPPRFVEEAGLAGNELLEVIPSKLEDEVVVESEKLEVLQASDSVALPALANAGAESGSQCTSVSYAFCCAVAPACDCKQGATAPGQCAGEIHGMTSYLYCCQFGTPCDCTQPPTATNATLNAALNEVSV